MEELRDENVHFEDVRDILPFDVSQDVYEPLKMPVRRANPQEINLGNKTIELYLHQLFY